MELIVLSYQPIGVIVHEGEQFNVFLQYFFLLEKLRIALKSIIHIHIPHINTKMHFIYLLPRYLYEVLI